MINKLSYQLYSSRNFPPLNETLGLLRSIGYGQVEGYGGLYENLNDLVNGLSDNKLTMPTGHFDLEMLENEHDKVLEIAANTKMTAIYCPYIAPNNRPTDSAGWKAFGERLKIAAKPFEKAGLIFGWHNHDFEFQHQADGCVPIDEIFVAAPDLSWEADIAWIIRGGEDPMDWILRHGDRISAVHIKDIAAESSCTDEDGWADVGQGIMNWPEILTVLKTTPAKYFVMEHDNPNDHIRFAERSFSNVSAWRSKQNV